MKFRKKPEIVEATQWYRAEDCPHVLTYIVPEDYHPSTRKLNLCEKCGHPSLNHGWIENNPNGRAYKICPGDWIITTSDGEYYVCVQKTFEKEYEKVKSVRIPKTNIEQNKKT